MESKKFKYCMNYIHSSTNFQNKFKQLLISGCTEHVDFLVNNSDDIDYINNFDEFVGDISPIIPKTSTRYIVLEEDTKSIEVSF